MAFLKISLLLECKLCASASRVSLSSGETIRLKRTSALDSDFAWASIFVWASTVAISAPSTYILRRNYIISFCVQILSGSSQPEPMNKEDFESIGANSRSTRLKLSKFGSLEPDNSDTFARNYTLSMIDKFENDLKTLKAEFKL